MQPNENNDGVYSAHAESHGKGPTACALSPNTRFPTWGVGRTSV